MKNAFSLFELIIVILILSIITSFIFYNVNSSIDTSNKIKIKSQIALIQNSIQKIKSKNILLGKEETFLLDEAEEEKENVQLFKNILDFPLISTSSTYKEIASWIKKSPGEYIVYINKDTFLKFEYDNNSFSCKSDVNLCKDFE